MTAQALADVRPVDDADRFANDLVLGELRAARPGDAILSEESKDEPALRLAANRVWIVDPLDGTREYFEEGRVDWAVHVALWEDGELVAGAVAGAADGAVLTTADPPPPPPPFAATGRSQVRVVVSRTRPPEFTDRVAAALGGWCRSSPSAADRPVGGSPELQGSWSELGRPPRRAAPSAKDASLLGGAEVMHMGSVGAKVASVIIGFADAYIHAGGQYEWDSAAPVVVARAAGLHASRIDGSPLRYNQPDPYLPDLVVCRPELAATILAAIGE